MASRASERTFYLDSSALIKLIVDEPETPALESTLGDSQGLVSSEIGLVEIPRAVNRLTSGLRRAQREALFEAAESVLRGIAFVPLRRELLNAAATFPQVWLRSLDAIHLASALEVAEDVEAMLTYDRRQAAAATHAGLPVDAPGADLD